MLPTLRTQVVRVSRKCLQAALELVLYQSKNAIRMTCYVLVLRLGD